MLRKRDAYTPVEILVVIVIIGVLVALLLPARQTPRVYSPRSQCMNNLKQIATALIIYEATHGSLPPAYTTDAEGNRLHSWRTLILPFLELSHLYEKIDLSKPWDDPANATAKDAVLQIYTCPRTPHENGLTTYLAVVGADCAFPGSEPRRFADITDGTDATIMVIDADSERAVHWMSPRDIEADDVIESVKESEGNHDGKTIVAFAAGNISSVENDIDEEELCAMLTIARREKID